MKKKNKFFYIGILFSFVLHCIFVIFISFNKLEKKNKKNIAYKIKFQNVTKPSKNIDEKKQKRLKQIVETVNQNESLKPEKQSYLSEKNNRVIRETVSKNVDKFQIAKKQITKREKTKTVAKKKKSENNMKKGISTLANLGIGLPPVLVKEKNEKNQTQTENSNSSNNGQAIASSSNDYLKTLPKSDLSQLNTVEFKHFGFYQRIKRQLEQYWGANLKATAAKIYKAGRKIASEEDFVTNLEITINVKGLITKIKVLGPSGIKELDDAAIDSFNSAGPFPNPPTDLISSSGEAIINWGFVVKS